MGQELRPIHDPTEAKRKRAFTIALTLSLTLVAVGWFYSFSQEISSLVGAIPETIASEGVQEVVTGFEEARGQTTEEFQDEMAPVLKEVAQQIEAQAEVTAATGEIIEEMKVQIETQTYGEQTQE